MRTAISLQVDNGNAGDTIATLAGRGLFCTAIGQVLFDTWFIVEEEPFKYNKLSLPRYDYAMALCTPWIWDRAHLSTKYSILLDFQQNIKSEKKIALGVGSSFLLDYDNSSQEKFIGQITTNSSKYYWNFFDKIICRDALAYELYSRIVSEEKLLILPCPSFYISQLFEIPHQPSKDQLLVFCHVSTANMWGLKQPHANAVMSYQDDLVRSGVDTATMIDRDHEAFVERYGRPPTVRLRHPLDVVRRIARYRRLVSARVHACMPALSLGLAVEIIPLDSRALTAIHLGAKPIAVGLDRLERYAQSIPPLSLEEMCAEVRDFAAIV